MRVLMLTRQVNPSATFFAFTHGWIRALAARVAQVDVICQEGSDDGLPANVTVVSLGKNRGISKVKQWRTFEQAAFRFVPHADVVFGHMMPQYAIAAMPAAVSFHKPVVQWYTLGHVEPSIRLAHRLVNRVVTASRESFPLPSRKLTVIGHGVDFSRFTPADAGPPPGPRIVLAVGSLTPWKGIERLMDAASLLLGQPGYEDVAFHWLGGELSGGLTPDGYRSSLEALIRAKGLDGRFHLLGAVPYPEVPAYYRRSTMLASLSQTGSIDKDILEAMGCGLPVVVTGPHYAHLFGDETPRLLARFEDPADIAAKIRAVLDRPPEARRALGLDLRERALAQHGLDGMMDRLVEVFSEVTGKSHP